MASASPTVESYLRRKAELAASTPARESCLRCRKPKITCYCADVMAPVDSQPRVAVLMHPLEAKHAVGTGRMAHQCLSNSLLITGIDFTRNERVNALINDPKLYPMVLFPGPKSVNLSQISPEARRAHWPRDREPVIIVLDGTWHLAKKMLHRSPNLQLLPRVSFTPDRLSGFLIRKQPHPQCFSTIEAIHELLSLFHPNAGPQPHDVLLRAFNDMVARQLSFHRKGNSRHSINYVKRKARQRALAQLRVPNDAPQKTSGA